MLYHVMLCIMQYRNHTHTVCSKFRSDDNSNLICFSCNIPSPSLLPSLSPLFLISLSLSSLLISLVSLSLSLPISVLEGACEGSESPRQRNRLRSPRTPIGARKKRREKTDRQKKRLVIIEIDHHHYYNRIIS